MYGHDRDWLDKRRWSRKVEVEVVVVVVVAVWIERARQLLVTACVKKHQRHQKHQEHQTGLDYPKLMDEASPSNAFSK